MSTAFIIGAAALALGAVIVALFLPARAGDHQPPAVAATGDAQRTYTVPVPAAAGDGQAGGTVPVAAAAGDGQDTDAPAPAAGDGDRRAAPAADPEPR